MRALVTRLQQLTAIRTAQRNQCRLVTDPVMQATLREILSLLAQQMEKLVTRIHELIFADPLWQRLDPVFRSIKGVADRMIARLMAEMPEIGSISNKTISKLAGVAPLAQDSGKHQGKRAVRGGRASVREILFIVASVVGRYEPDSLLFSSGLQRQACPAR